MEIVPQHVYVYEDGLPSYKSGEWPLKKPSRWRGSKLILKPLHTSQVLSFESKKIIINILKTIESLGGQRHFPPKLSDEYVYIPEKKLVKPIIHDDSFKPSKRYIEPKYTEPKKYKRNVKVRPLDQIDQPTTDAPLFVSKRHYNVNDLFSKKETNIEGIMTRKKRIFDLHQQRNGLLVFNPGDKLYRCVENSPDFFKLEGIVVGSTHQLHPKRNGPRSDDNFYETLDLRVKSLNPDKLWKSKVLRDSLEHDKNYVESLANWENNILNEEATNDDKNKK